VSDREGIIMVIAVRCAAEKCRKYQLVEDTDRGKVVNCLICKAAIRVPAETPPPPPPSVANLPTARRL
jgi:hypothetical protein